MENQNEIWKPVKNYEGLYEISSLSRVRSLDRVTITKKGKRIYKGKILKGVEDKKTKYLIYAFSKNGIVKNERIHVIMAINFLDHIPNGFNIIVDHIDENPQNNSLNNLQLISHRKNIGKSKILISNNNYTGVYFHIRNKKWLSSVTHNKKTVHLGYFDTEIDALKIRNEYLLKHNLF